MFDVLITNGKIIDGTGAPSKYADIGIKGEAISEIGNLSNCEAKTVLNATGMVVCPGFIDAHSHSDAYLLIEPSAPSKIFQGITTEVVGNCGASASPLVGAYHMPSDWADKDYPEKWSSVAEYRTLLNKLRPALNVFMLIGHNTLRTGVAGYENRPLSEDELKKIITIFESALDEGGKGLSTGLIYPPGMFAPKEELIELAKIAGRYNGIYTSHMRSEGKQLLYAIDEAISIGQASGCRVEISHLKTSGKQNWWLIDQALEKIRNARASGVDVAADRYPYTSACTELDVIFPDWAEEGGREEIVARLKNPVSRARIRDYLLDVKDDTYWATVTVGSTSYPENKKYRGKSLVDVAAMLEIDPVDAALYLIETDEAKTGAFFFGMNEENMCRILKEPYVMIGTDASLRATTGPLSMDYPHPRAYGSFPRFLRLVLDKKLMSIEKAIRKMTSLPAQHFRLIDRGVIGRGNKADIAIFDPGKIADLSDYSNPHQLSQGIETLIVNGTITIRSGKSTDDRNGYCL